MKTPETKTWEQNCGLGAVKLNEKNKTYKRNNCKKNNKKRKQTRNKMTVKRNKREQKNDSKNKKPKKTMRSRRRRRRTKKQQQQQQQQQQPQPRQHRAHYFKHTVLTPYGLTKKKFTKENWCGYKKGFLAQCPREFHWRTLRRIPPARTKRQIEPLAPHCPTNQTPFRLWS